MAYDTLVANIRWIPDIPIIWDPLPHLTFEDSNERRFRLRDYVNAPRGQTTFELHPDYELPNDQWRLFDSGTLRYRPIIGRTVGLRFNALRGNLTEYSDTLRITREVAFITRLVPNRLFLGAAFNESTSRLYIYNGTLTAARFWISSFDLEGNEQPTESQEVTAINETAHSGMGFDGTRWWVCGRDRLASDRDIVTINLDGTQEAVYDYTGGDIESIAYHGGAMWGLDIINRQLRKFSLEGVEDTDATITLARAQNTLDQEGFYFTQGQYGLTRGDGHWWIPQYHISGHHYIFCADDDGNAVSSRHFEVPFGTEAGGTCVGVAWQANQRNLWHIHDIETDDGDRVGTIRVKHIA